MKQLPALEILDLAADAVIAIDGDQRIVFFNLKAQELFGYRVEDALGESLDLLIPEALRDVHRRHVLAFAGSGERSRLMSMRDPVRARRADGSEFLAEVSISRLPEEMQPGFVAVLRDVTEREQARAIAALEERHRLARELHDSFSQALYGIILGAKTARSLLDTDPARAAEPLDYLQTLAESSLAEIRALILDLRPESLAKDGLVASLKARAEVLRSRHHLHVVTHLCDEPEARLEVKEAVLRVAREALHNTVKHARATWIEVSLARDGRCLVLKIRDDGVGFDASAAFPGHLGLESMHERVADMGGDLEISSSLGQGTQLLARFPL